MTSIPMGGFQPPQGTYTQIPVGQPAPQQPSGLLDLLNKFQPNQNAQGLLGLYARGQGLKLDGRTGGQFGTPTYGYQPPTTPRTPGAPGTPPVADTDGSWGPAPGTGGGKTRPATANVGMQMPNDGWNGTRDVLGQPVQWSGSAWVPISGIPR